MILILMLIFQIFLLGVQIFLHEIGSGQYYCSLLNAMLVGFWIAEVLNDKRE